MPERLETVHRGRQLDHDVGRDLRELAPLLDHAVGVGGDDLEAHGPVHDPADLLDQVAKRPLLLGDQRGIGCRAVEEPIAVASLSSVTLAVSRKIFIASQFSSACPPARLGPRRRLLGRGLSRLPRSRRTRSPARTARYLGVSLHPPEHVHGARGTALGAAAGRRRPEKMQNARPGGQYPRSPSPTTGWASSSASETGTGK